MSLQRPMLAVAAEPAVLRTLTWPRLASAKLDGVRALCRRNPETGTAELVSRTLKPIPNVFTQNHYALDAFVGLDGELTVGDPTDKNVMQHTMSGVMSEDGTPDVMWHVFDSWSLDTAYCLRAQTAKATTHYFAGAPFNKRVHWLSQHPVYSYEELVELEEQFVEQGYEGLILRCPHAPYKQNRSTLKQAYMLKMKRFVDGEALIIGMVELQHNDNEATVDERGYTKRSTHLAGKSAGGTMGALQVRDLVTGVEFEIGTGFTAEQRKNLWDGQKYMLGRIAKYKHFPVGVKDKPRHPVFLGIRDRRDM